MAKLREHLIETARGAGGVLMEHFRKLNRSDIEYKGAINLVTEADLAAEEFILERIETEFPDHGILAEESGAGGNRDESAEYRWIIDPLDGTTNFTHGFPLFCVSIAVEKAGELRLGTVYDPLHDELFFAERGQGALLNGRSIEVSSQQGLERALLATGFPYSTIEDEMIRNLEYFSTFMRECRGIRRAGSAAIDLCYVACGRYDGFWELELSTWDVAAGALIAEEAGAVVSDVLGGELELMNPDPLAANPDLYDRMREVIDRAERGLAGDGD